jgi:hypothetical protein
MNSANFACTEFPEVEEIFGEIRHASLEFIVDSSPHVTFLAKATRWAGR